MGDYRRSCGKLVLAIVPPPSLLSSCLAGSGQLLLFAGCLVARTSLKAAPAECAYVGGLSQQPVWWFMWEEGGKGAIEIQGKEFDRMTSLPSDSSISWIYFLDVNLGASSDCTQVQDFPFIKRSFVDRMSLFELPIQMNPVLKTCLCYGNVQKTKVKHTLTFVDLSPFHAHIHFYTSYIPLSHWCRKHSCNGKSYFVQQQSFNELSPS